MLRAGGSAGMSRTFRRPAGESGRDCTYQGAPTLAIICNVELRLLRANLEPTLKNSEPAVPPLHPPPTTSTSYLECCNAVPVCAEIEKTIAYLFPLRENSNNCSGGSSSGGTLPEVSLTLPILDVEGAFGIVK